MQTSITSFFKVKPPPGSKKKDDHESGGGDEQDDGDENKRNKVVDFEDDDDDSVRDVQPKTRDNKRQLESEDEDDDDEDNIPVSKNRKRSALSSTETTPVKSNVIAPSPAPVKMDTSSGDGQGADDDEPKKTAEIKTAAAAAMSPVRPPSAATQMMAAASPLFNVETLIKKKIESGAMALHENMGPSWFRALQGEFDKAYFKKLSTFVEQQRNSNTVYPPADQVFTWTHFHPIRDTRVVVIGQDPYHGPNQAHGLSFSVQRGVAVPKSLINIYKELESDIPGFKHPGHGNLTGWSKQGVLMLNACLTVNHGMPNSHQGKGWETFTDATISWISKNATRNCVFLLWGRFALQKSKLIDKRHKILTSPHPSPLSAHQGFFGCKHFSQANAFLRTQKLPEIDWTAL